VGSSWSLIMNRWLPLILSESIAVPLAAQLATVSVVAAIDVLQVVVRTSGEVVVDR
jgi:hypothetical protein